MNDTLCINVGKNNNNIIITTYAIKLNFIDRLQFVFDVIYAHIFFSFPSLSNVFISLLCINHKSMNVTGYTRSSSKVCVCMFTQMGKDRFLFLFVYTSPNNRRRLLLERRATLLKYLILQYINRVSKKKRERESKKRIGRHSHD